MIKLTLEGTVTHAELQDALRSVLEAGPNAQELVTHNGFVFKHFPKEKYNEAPVNEAERWEILAFQLYANLWRCTNAAEALVKALETKQAQAPQNRASQAEVA